MKKNVEFINKVNLTLAMAMGINIITDYDYPLYDVYGVIPNEKTVSTKLHFCDNWTWLMAFVNFIENKQYTLGKYCVELTLDSCSVYRLHKKDKILLTRVSKKGGLLSSMEACYLALYNVIEMGELI